MEKLEKQQSLNMVTLLSYGTDLTKLAEEGKLDPLIGRDKEVERVTQILCKRRKNNPCLVGDPGVGKTVIAEGLAQGIVKATVPLKLQNKKIISLDLGRLIAGTMYRGEYEERLTDVIDEVKKSNGQIILFIDEVHTLIGHGYGKVAANILKPPLARGEVTCIGATTFDEYRKYIEKDGALKRRFQSVQVPEPSVEETVQILQGLSKKYEVHHNVVYNTNSLVAAAKLSNHYITSQFLPDKAIDLIDEAGSRVQLKNNHSQSITRKVKEKHIELVVSSLTGIPIGKVSKDQTRRLLKMEEALQKHVVGQEEAVAAVSRAIRRARVGVRDPTRPIASFLFTGPTGVGKTELAKSLAIEYFGSEEAMVRLDMSEYMEKHTVSRLFGSPPGYVGYDEGGQLTEAVRLRPHALILLDEIEKAHRDVFNALLQVLDDGRLTDGKGQNVDFKNTIIIMTSNLGSDLITNDSGSDQLAVAIVLKKHFRPEFLNRIDEIVVFKKLTESQLKVIVEIMLTQIQERLKEAKNIKLKVTEKFKAKLVKEGYLPSYGARALRRAMMRMLEDTLAEKILDGTIKEGTCVTVHVNYDGDVITLVNLPK